MPWILLFLPLIVAAVNQLVLKKTGLVPIVSTASAVATFVIALLLLGKTTGADCRFHGRPSVTSPSTSASSSTSFRPA